MTVPTPPADASGGYIIIKAQGGGQTHRMRFHVEPFTNDSLGTYNVTTGGREANVQATAADIMRHLQTQFHPSVTLSLDAVFWKNAGVISELFTVTPPASVVGTGSGAIGLTEEYQCFNLRTLLGGRFRFFCFGSPGWTYQVPLSIPAGNGTSNQQLVSYLTGGLPTGDTVSTRIVGHDGAALVAPAHVTFGVNKRLRRRAGDA